MSRRRSFLIALVIVLLFSCFAKSEGLRKSDIPSLMNRFLYMHVQYNELTDVISTRTIENFILHLDYGKNYFMMEDVVKFREYGPALLANIKTGNYAFIDSIVTVYRQRFAEGMRMASEQISVKHDFNVDEKILIDSEKIEWASTKKELSERWRKSVKLQLLNYISAGQTPDEAKKKLDKKYQLLAKRVEQYDENKIISIFLNAFSTALDPHSNYLSQEEHEDFKISMELKLEGIGVRLRSEDGFAIVDSIIPGGAADKLSKDKQLKPNDRIVAVAQASDEPVDVIDLELREVVNKIRGKKGTEVRLTIIRSAEDAALKTRRLIVPIIREEILLQDSEVKSEIYIQKIRGKEVKIGYLKLPSFYMDPATGKSSSGDMLTHITSLKKGGAQAVVLDLRGNPGGLLNESIDIAGLFIAKGPVVQIKDGGNNPRILYDENTDIEFDGPLLILIDKFSASASEILAGAMKDHKRAIVIGSSNTYGKGTVQSYNELPNKKGAIKVTTHIFYQPGGTSNQLHGVVPDIIVPDMSSIWQIGEAKIRFPLTWEKIKPAWVPQNTLYSNSQLIRSLQAKSTARVNSDPDYKEYLAKISKLEKQVSNRYISLKEESDLEKQKRKEFDRSNGEGAKQLIDLKNDLFLNEVFNITADYLQQLDSVK
jgi:carboxyl-terminal processing protease